MDPLSFFGLTQEPFSNTPVSRFYYDSAQSGAALIRLRRAVDQMKGLAVVVGDIGAGKTTLARKFLDSLPEADYEAALLVIIHSGVSSDWLLRRIGQQLGIEHPSEDKVQLLGQLYQRLLAIEAQGKKTVVLIDEAQMLHSQAIMEELRGILNLELPEKKLITFVLFGLSDIESCLSLDPPLAQRVAVKVKLHPLDLIATQAYVEHRLRLAGAKSKIFDESAMQGLYQYSKGSPRLINTLADNALFEATLTQKKSISSDIMMRVAQDLGLTAFEITNFVTTSPSPLDSVPEVSVPPVPVPGPDRWEPSEADASLSDISLGSFEDSFSFERSHQEAALGFDLIEDEDFVRKAEPDSDNTDFLLKNLEELPDDPK